MGIKDKVFLVASRDGAQRQLALASAKKYIPEELFKNQMVTTVYAAEANLSAVQNDLLTFSFIGQKAFIFKNADLFSQDIRDFFIENIVAISENVYLVFEIEEDLAALQGLAKKDRLIALLLAETTVIKTSAARPEVTIKDFMSAVTRRDVNVALAVMEKLFSLEREEKLAPSIIGFMTSQASNINDIDKKKKSLQYLWDADRAIKERGHNSRIILEALVVRMLTL